MIPLFPPLWAVHIGDSTITPIWCAGGFVLAGLLALWGAWRIRDEEIPQLAVMTATFFLAGLIMVPIPAGPRTHLLLNGLLGVVLGRRAMLAVLVGLFLQSATFVMHGVGFSTLGVNACVMGIPALAAWGLFAGLQRLPWIRHPLFRAGLVAVSTLAFSLSLIYAISALITTYSLKTALTWEDLTSADQITFHPLTLTFALLLAGAAVWIERRLDHAVEFPLGLLVGEFAVLLTILLNGLVLLFGGITNWDKVVLLTFIIHLPLAVVEGIVLGFTVGFLARVKPQLLYGYRLPPAAAPLVPALPSAQLGKISVLLLAPLLVLLVGAKPAFAHYLNADYKLLPDKRIRIESWFSNGDLPRNAKVRVTGADGTVLEEGETGVDGVFVFHYEKVENLKILVYAGMGHQNILEIPETELAKTGVPPLQGATSPLAQNHETLTPHASEFQPRDLLIAFGFIFGLAGFVLSLRHAAVLRELRRKQEKP